MLQIILLIESKQQLNSSLLKKSFCIISQIFLNFEHRNYYDIE